MEKEREKKKSQSENIYTIKYSGKLLNLCLIIYLALIFALGYMIKT